MGKDVLAGVDGVLGQCNAVVEAPPARTPHQVYKPYITEPFYGNHANRVLSYLTEMGDIAGRGYSIPAQWSANGRLDVDVIEASPLLNANRWDSVRFLLEHAHRILLRASRSTSMFVKQSVEAFPLFPTVKLFNRYGLSMVKSWFASAWKLMRPVVMPIWDSAKLGYRTWLRFYRKHIRTLRFNGPLSVPIVAISPINLRYTMPYEKEGLSATALFPTALAWVIAHFPLVIPPALVMLAAFAAAFIAVAPFLIAWVCFWVGWAIALFWAFVLGAIWLVIAFVVLGAFFSAGVIGGVVGDIVSWLIPIIGGAVGTSLLFIVFFLCVAIWVIGTVATGGAAGLITFWIVAVVWWAVALFWLAVAALWLLLMAGIFLIGLAALLVVFSSIIMVPLISLIVVTPLWLTHYVVCCCRRLDVELFGTFSSPYFSDARKVV